MDNVRSILIAIADMSQSFHMNLDRISTVTEGVAQMMNGLWNWADNIG